MPTDCIIAVFILTDMMRERLERRSQERVRATKTEKGTTRPSVCYDVTRGPHQSIRHTTGIFRAMIHRVRQYPTRCRTSAVHCGRDACLSCGVLDYGGHCTDPPAVDHIIVVDDASPDNLQEVLQKIPDQRLIVLGHKANRGVRWEMKTGFTKALELEADIIIKIDGDGQMDPQLIPQFVWPIIADHADLTKGNRFDLSCIRQIPLIGVSGI